MEDLRQKLIEARGGERLGTLLTSLVGEIGQKRAITREVLITDMAKEAGIHKSTVVRILKGKVKNPPIRRIDGFAKVLRSNA